MTTQTFTKKAEAMVCYPDANPEFVVRKYRADDFPLLLEMYHDFSPKGKFQGMPPLDEKVREKWISNLVVNGHNFIVWHNGKVMGHVVIIPDFIKKDAEYLIFILQPARKKGLGRALTTAALEEARSLHLRKVWLTVDAYNIRAIKLYRKFDFEFLQACTSESERMMALELN